MTIKAKNTLFLMAVAMILLLIVLGITYLSTTAIVKQSVIDHQQAIAKEVSRTTEMWLSQQMKILDATVTSVTTGDYGDNQETMRLLKMAMKAGDFSDVYIGTSGGVMIDGADWFPPKGYDPRQRPWYQKAIETGRTALTTPFIDMVTMELVIALVAPLTVDGSFAGVMAADTVLDNLVDNVLNTRVGESGYAFIIQGNGTILIHPDQNYVMKAKLQDIEPELGRGLQILPQSASGALFYREKKSLNEHILAYQKIAGTDWYMCTTLPREEAYQLARKSAVLYAAEQILVVLAALALLTLTGCGGSVLLLLTFTKRFKLTVKKQTEEITGINKDLSWNISKRMEVETHYQTLFNVANDAILVSKKLQYVDCNERAIAMYGVGRSGVIGRSMLDFSPEFQPDGRESREVAKSISENPNTGGPQFFEWTFQRSDGTEFPAEVGLKILQLDNEELTLSSIRDISKRVDAEKQLRQAQKMAAMGEMLGAIAHQWRQPLNALSTYIASLQPAWYNQKIDRDFVEKLTSGADLQIQFMSKTIDDFRHFFRPSKSKAPFNVTDAVDNAIQLMEAQLKQGGIQLNVNRQDAADALIVSGYQSEFVHVLVNILANARDAVAESLQENPEADHRISISLTDLGHEVSLRIDDCGKGIPAHLIGKIFTPYFTTKGTMSGTGIGLYMAKIIVENEMHGVLTVENTGHGASFTIRLPKAQTDD